LCTGNIRFSIHSGVSFLGEQTEEEREKEKNEGTLEGKITKKNKRLFYILRGFFF